VFERIVGMRVQTIFILDDLAVELVRQIIDRDVEIRMLALDEYVLAGKVTGDFRFLSQVVPGEDHVDIDDVIKMPPDPGELALDVVTESGRDCHVMSADCEVHAK